MSKLLESILIGSIVVLFCILLHSMVMSAVNKDQGKTQQVVLDGGWICTQYRTKNILVGKSQIPHKKCVQYTKE